MCVVGDRGEERIHTGYVHERQREEEGDWEKRAKGTIREIVGRLSLLFEDNNGSIRSRRKGTHPADG